MQEKLHKVCFFFIQFLLTFTVFTTKSIYCLWYLLKLMLCFMKLVSCQLSLYTQTRRPCHQVVVLTREVRWQETRGGVHTVHCTIGWSDLPLFAIFRMGHIAADQIYIHTVFVRVGNSLFGFLCQLLVFLEQKCKILNAFCTLLVKSKWLRPIFFKEQAERIPLLL